MMKIERVTQFNFLCIVLSSNLKWNKHTDHISKKISRAIGVMYRLKQIYSHVVLLTLYQAIIYPHFISGLLVWGSKIENGHPLHLLQKKALRIVAIKIILLILNLFEIIEFSESSRYVYMCCLELLLQTHE